MRPEPTGGVRDTGRLREDGGQHALWGGVVDEYAGRVLAERYRLPLRAPGDDDFTETRAFDTYSGQEVLVRQVPLPEVVDAEVVEAEPADGRHAHRRTTTAGVRAAPVTGAAGVADRSPRDPAVRRALEAATAAAQLPDHPRLEQVFDVFAQHGSLWIVGELVAARPLAALLAERALSAHRAAEIAADVLTALRALHTQGWVHRNITARTVLVCVDGRVVLTGLAVGAAQEALCGYAPVPGERENGPGTAPHAAGGAGEVRDDAAADAAAPVPSGPLDAPGSGSTHQRAASSGAASGRGVPRPAPAPDANWPPLSGGRGVPAASGTADGTSGTDAMGDADASGEPGVTGGDAAAGRGPEGDGVDPRRVRAGAIAAYRAGARAAAVRAPLPNDEAGRNGSGDDASVRPVPGVAGAGAHGVPGARQHDDTDFLPEPEAGADAGPDAGRVTGFPEGSAPGSPGRPEGGIVPSARQGTAEGPWFSPYSDHIEGSAGQGAGRPEDAGVAHGADDRTGTTPGGGRGGSLPGPTAGGGRGADPLPAPRREASGAEPTGPGTGSGDTAETGELSAPAAPARTSLTKTAPAPVASPGAAAAEQRGPASLAYGRPSAALAAERARQARLQVIGPVTERWAPEQAGPVHENWQLAPPVGPATDLWAVGALLFRSVQGHPPFPEESAAELAQLVCSQPPAPAEECGALRPVVESLLREDPGDRPDVEELRGWLRSLIRTAPEPELGSRVVTVPSRDRAADPGRLPIVRRRGELVRKGRHKKTRARRERRPQETPAAAARATAAPSPRPQRLPKQPKPLRGPAPARLPEPPRSVGATGRAGAARQGGGPAAEPSAQQGPVEVGWDGAPPRRSSGAARGPRRLGLLLLGLVFLLLVAAVVYAMVFLPKSGAEAGQGGADRVDTPGPSKPGSSAASGDGSHDGQGEDGDGDGGASGTRSPQTGAPADLDQGFEARSDPEGFQVGVRKGWERRGENDRGQVRYVGGDFELVVVPGRDTTARFGADPMAYQQDKEAELAPYRDSSWSSASGLRRIDVGKTAMAEGTFTWRDSSGREVYVRNLAMIHEGRYHLVLLIGPDNERREVDHLYDQATDAYRPG
ncbi:protein kinase [Streptomyces sp. NPDC048248]|uniref:protein kinase n=1 Tax=Streptomyces sp. NPDC048248 TaxID=3365523 RepID=UPI003711C584